MTRIVVTGALGHIGSYLIRELPLRHPESEILLIDNLMTQRYASLFHLPIAGRFRFVEADVTKRDLRPLFENAQVVVHLAAITDAAGSFGRAAELEANNYQGTERVVEACIATGTRLLALSSTSVYGTQAATVSEDCAVDDLKPQSPYAETKLKEERLVASYGASGRLQAVCCRFGTIFGASPGMRFHTAVNKFCWQAIMEEPLTVWRTAYDQKRPYLDLSDATRAISFIIKNNLFDGKIYNVLTVNATVRDIVETIRRFVPKVCVQLVDSPIMNQLSYQVSCERFRKQGFEFTGDLDRGIGETVALLRGANGLPW